jgi:hypothetical protein
MTKDGFTAWEQYWSSKTLIETDRGKFNTYRTSASTPFVILCIHGGP